IIEEHSHPMSNNIQMVTLQYRHLMLEMQDEIELLATNGSHTGTIINVLIYKYPHQYIHTHNVYNIVQMVRAEKEKLSDAGAAYKELIYKKQEMPTIETERIEELYDLYQQLIEEIKKQLAEQEGCLLQSDNDDYYEA
ncbi:27973_t:CDS:2, partial [Gigaspora margarita]